MDQPIIKTALFQLLEQGIENWELLLGVALGLSASGRSRVQIMGFFWDFMAQHERQLPERQMDLIGDFCFDLLGRGPTEHFIRLHGDPEDPREFVEKVIAEARQWKAPLPSGSR